MSGLVLEMTAIKTRISAANMPAANSREENSVFKTEKKNVSLQLATQQRWNYKVRQRVQALCSDKKNKLIIVLMFMLCDENIKWCGDQMSNVNPQTWWPMCNSFAQ